MGTVPLCQRHNGTVPMCLPCVNRLHVSPHVLIAAFERNGLYCMGVFEAAQGKQEE